VRVGRVALGAEHKVGSQEGGTAEGISQQIQTRAMGPHPIPGKIILYKRGYKEGGDKTKGKGKSEKKNIVEACTFIF